MKKSCVFLGYGKNRVFLALAFKCPHSRVWCTSLGTAWVNGTLVEAVNARYVEAVRAAIWSSDETIPGTKRSRMEMP